MSTSCQNMMEEEKNKEEKSDNGNVKEEEKVEEEEEERGKDAHQLSEYDGGGKMKRRKEDLSQKCLTASVMFHFSFF